LAGDVIPFLSLEPMHAPLREKFLSEFTSVLEASNYVLGSKVEKFEREYARYQGAKHCIGVGNGLDAIRIALEACGVGAGDEVIVPSNTFIATALAVSQLGAKPVLVEPRLDTYNLDPKQIANALTAKTKALMPVHLYGQPCEMDAIMEIAKSRGLAVIEDNAQSHGSTYRGKQAGTFGAASATSFYPGKNLGALGDGGAITTDQDSIAHDSRMIRNYGSVEKYRHERKGLNSRLDEVQAALLSVKLDHLEAWNIERRKIAAIYDSELKGVGDLATPYVAEGAVPVYHLYVIRTRKRDALQAHLTERRIGTMIHYPTPIHLQKAYADLGHRAGDFPIAEEISRTCLSLPLYPGLGGAAIERVVSAIKGFYA
jgi:dTDP-4-amino-4,6-dideoxygalactose transaminase